VVPDGYLSDGEGVDEEEAAMILSRNKDETDKSKLQRLKEAERQVKLKEQQQASKKTSVYGVVMWLLKDTKETEKSSADVLNQFRGWLLPSMKPITDMNEHDIDAEKAQLDTPNKKGRTRIETLTEEQEIALKEMIKAPATDANGASAGKNMNKLTAEFKTKFPEIPMRLIEVRANSLLYISLTSIRVEFVDHLLHLFFFWFFFFWIQMNAARSQEDGRL
jgi:hypothetical protein